MKEISVKKELEEFAKNHYSVLSASIKYFLYKN